MKIIIDISKELKQKIDEGYTNQVIINKLWDATRNGIPLDKISAEIIENAKGTMNDTRAEGLYMALKIIDKYMTNPKDIEMQATEFLAEARACAESEG